MSQNEKKNEIINDNEQNNVEKTSNIIKGINAVVIPNIEESSQKSITEETNFEKIEETTENVSNNYSQLNEQTIKNENYNIINNENPINNYQNEFNNNFNNDDNNINQFHQENFDLNNNLSSNQDKEINNFNSNTNNNNIQNNLFKPEFEPNNGIEQNQNILSDPALQPQAAFSSSYSNSSKNYSKKRSSYDKKGNQKSMKDLAYKFPIRDAFSKVEIPFSFQQNLDDPNNDSRFHSYITIRDTPKLFIDISDEKKVDKLNMAAKIDNYKSKNNELETKLKAVDDNIMKYKEDNSILNKEIEKIKNEIISRNNEINKLKQKIQQLNQGNNKYENDIKQKIQTKDNSYIKLKEIYDTIKNDLTKNVLDENQKKEYLLKINEETNKIQKEYQNNFKYYTNKLMNYNLYPEEYIKQCLQKDLIDFNNYIGARIQMISPKVKELITYIQNAVDASIGKEYEVKLYGSHATGLCLPWSDIDVVLCKRNGEDIDANFYITLHDLYTYLKEKNDFKDIKHIGTTTVPLIKIKTKENIGIQSVDISLQDKSHYGIKCVSLVLSFKEEYEVFLPMILALKNILKQANLNDPYKVSIFIIIFDLI